MKEQSDLGGVSLLEKRELPIMLVWHESNDLRIYWLENLDPQDRENLVSCHGYYINRDLNIEWTAWLSDFMGSIEGGERWCSEAPTIALATSEPCQVIISGRVDNE